MNEKIGVGILGGTGYGAGELLRLLIQHQNAEVASVVSNSHSGQAITAHHSHLNGFYNMPFDRDLNIESLNDFSQAVVFSALPNGISSQQIEKILPKLETIGAKLVDLSGDFRLTDEETHAMFYPESSKDVELRSKFTYAVPDLSKEEIKNARHISNPGCLAIASILASSPLMQFPLAAPLAIDAKTGSTGSGRQLKTTTHHPSRHGNYWAYKELEHQHEPEIIQALRGLKPSKNPGMSFIAQSLPLSRGIFISVHATLEQEATYEAMYRHFQEFYQLSPFVRVLRNSPQIGNVVGTNFCDISVAARGKQVVVLAAVDNLIKGMAGTAIQNLNLLCGIKETTGLWQAALGPAR